MICVTSSLKYKAAKNSFHLGHSSTAYSFPQCFELQGRKLFFYSNLKLKNFHLQFDLAAGEGSLLS